jgi:hypothetical protein
VSSNDRWDDLPDVVAQLQAEASSAAPPPPRSRPAPERVPAPERAPAVERPIFARSASEPPAAPPPFDRAPPFERAPSASSHDAGPIDAAFELDDAWSERLTSDDDRTILRARAVPTPGAPAKAAAPELTDDDIVEVEVEEEVETVTWPGLADYDALLAARNPDPAALLGRLATTADEVLGERARILRPLFDRLTRQVEQLLAPPPAAPELRDARLDALTRGLDKLEDVFAALMVHP